MHLWPSSSSTYLDPLELNGVPVDISRRKVMALLVYLVATQQPQRRDMLGTLFWPESSQKSARASLRRELHALIQLIGEGWLNTTRETIELNPDADVWVDIELFRQLVAEADHTQDGIMQTLTTAIELYQGDFLAGFTLSDCPEFDDWQLFETDALRSQAASVLQMLVHHYEIQGVFELAIGYARRWLALDIMHEPAHRVLMRLFALAGQQAAALRQYDECVRILDEELGISSEKETSQLYEAIRKRQFPDRTENRQEDNKEGRQQEWMQDRQQPSPPHNLPIHPTPFIGRENELTAIRDLLTEQDDCRLLTLVGSGGVGKTRLAIEAASGLLDAFPDGVYFVGLASVSSAANIMPAIAGALGYGLQSADEPEAQIMRYLNAKKLLLIMDNFEHLIDSAHLLTNVSKAAIGVKLLVASRDSLSLQEEWLYPVRGMTVPTGTKHLLEAEQNAAVQLFVQCARRADASFELNETNLNAVVRICQLVDGLPLGLELAATWVRLMPCADIATEIAKSIDILATSLRNVPERHRSLRAVLEQTWQRLSKAESTSLSILSVFRGGWARKAASEVADADLTLLASLIDKSLLRRTATDRYDMHELVRN